MKQPPWRQKTGVRRAPAGPATASRHGRPYGHGGGCGAPRQDGPTATAQSRGDNGANARPLRRKRGADTPQSQSPHGAIAARRTYTLLYICRPRRPAPAARGLRPKIHHKAETDKLAAVRRLAAGLDPYQAQGPRGLTHVKFGPEKSRKTGKTVAHTEEWPYLCTRQSEHIQARRLQDNIGHTCVPQEKKGKER